MRLSFHFFTHSFIHSLIYSLHLLAANITVKLTFGARSKNQFNKHEFKKKKIEHNRIRVTRFQQPGTRFLNRVISQLTMDDTRCGGDQFGSASSAWFGGGSALHSSPPFSAVTWQMTLNDVRKIVVHPPMTFPKTLVAEGAHIFFQFITMSSFLCRSVLVTVCDLFLVRLPHIFSTKWVLSVSSDLIFQHN